MLRKLYPCLRMIGCVFQRTHIVLCLQGCQVAPLDVTLHNWVRNIQALQVFINVKEYFFRYYYLFFFLYFLRFIGTFFLHFICHNMLLSAIGHFLHWFTVQVELQGDLKLKVKLHPVPANVSLNSLVSKPRYFSKATKGIYTFSLGQFK